MQQIELTAFLPDGVNVELLEEEIYDDPAVGLQVQAVSNNRGGLFSCFVSYKEDFTAGQIVAIEAIATAHNPNGMSGSQSIAEAREVARQTLRLLTKADYLALKNGAAPVNDMDDANADALVALGLIQP